MKDETGTAVLDFLQTHNARLEGDGRHWIVWGEGCGKWELYHQPYGQRVQEYGAYDTIKEAIEIMKKLMG